MVRVNWKKIFVYTLFFLISAAALVFLYSYRSKLGRILSPIFIAAVIAYIVAPLSMKLQRRGVPKTLSILSVYLFFTALAGSAAVFVVPELVGNIKELTETLPGLIIQYQELLNDFLSSIQSSKWSEDIKSFILREINSGAAAAQSLISEGLKSVLEGFVTAVTTFFDLTVGLVIAYYLLKDAERFKEMALNLAPKRWRNGLTATGREINLVLSNFIQGQLLTAIIIGALETIGLLIVGVRYPLVLGLIGGLSNIIPYFGPIIGAVPAVAVSLLESPGKAVWTALVFIAVQQLDNNFISPKIIEGRLGMHPVTTILAVLIGGEFFGIPGMFLAVPAAAILKVIVKRTVEAIV